MIPTFISYAVNILADTNSGLTGSEIIKKCNEYAMQYQQTLTHSNNMPTGVNKRTVLYDNLLRFTEPQQLNIVKELCELPKFKGNNNISSLKNKALKMITGEKLDADIIKNTNHWLGDYPNILKIYNGALFKYSEGQHERNIVDDMRLSLELLVKALLNNAKSLENNIRDLGKSLKECNVPDGLRNMITKLITDYSTYQNHYAKHNDKVKENEVEFIIEFTSTTMKFLIKVLG